MFDYWLATFRRPDGTLVRRTRCGGSEDELRRLYGKGEEAFVAAEPRELPEWGLVEPVLTEAIVVDGTKRYSLRGHLLRGGVLQVDYRGRTYTAVPTMFGEDREIVVDGRCLDCIGTVELSCEGARPHVLHLDTLDESHAMDTLSGGLIEYDGEVSAVLPATDVEDHDTVASVIRKGAFQGLALAIRKAQPTFVFDEQATEYDRGEILHYAADIGRGQTFEASIGRDEGVMSRLVVRTGHAVACEIVDSDITRVHGSPFGAWTRDHGPVGHEDVVAFVRGIVDHVRANSAMDFQVLPVEVSDGSWSFSSIGVAPENAPSR